MAKKKQSDGQKLAQAAAKQIKKSKHPLLVVIIILAIVALAALGYYIYVKKFKPQGPAAVGELEIHFLNLNNSHAGDYIYIRAGENDILVDAGSTRGSAAAICDYVDDFVTDKKLEFVIATHADEDHIAGFAGSGTVPGVFDEFECQTIIDFPRTNKTTDVYNDYVSKRSAEVENGAKHFTALECYNNVDQAKRTYQLANSISLEILYNYYYEHNSSDENNYSVCFRIIHGSEQFLFTGDLEKEGEEYLVENNNLSKVKLFKAGHHGSPTSSNDVLLDIIRPEICVVPCVAGTDEYAEIAQNQFPSQAFINRISKHTSQVYVPLVVSDNKNGFEIMCGTIVICSNAGNVDVRCSNQKIMLKDSEWFLANRQMPSQWLSAS